MSTQMDALTTEQVLARLRAGSSISEPDVKIKDQDGCTILHIAAKAGEEDIIRQIADLNVDLSPKNNNHWTPLHYAADYNHEATAKILLGLGANLEATTRTGRTSLLVAAEKGHDRMVGLLLNQNACVTARTHNSHTALHLAAQNGHENVIQQLLQKDIDLEASNNKKWTALHFAARYGHGKIARLLLEGGANISASDEDHWTPLHFAARYNFDQVAQILLEKDASIEACDKDKRTALWLAAQHSCEKVTLLLLEKNANIEFCNKDEWTPLHAAAFSGRDEVAQLLTERNASISARAYDACTPLMLAAEQGNYSVARMLLFRGASVDDRDKSDWTALHYAARWGHKAVVELLLEQKADLSIKSKKGRTALMVAERYKKTSIVERIRDHSGNNAAKLSEPEDSDPEENPAPSQSVIKSTPETKEVTLNSDVLIQLFEGIQSTGKWKIDPKTGLCQVCSNLKLGDLFHGGELQHHLSLGNLKSAGNSGCKLCSLIAFNGFDSMTESDEDFEIVCEVAWDENFKFFSGYQNSGTVQAIRFRKANDTSAHYHGSSCTVGICTTQDDPLAKKVPYRLVAPDSSSQESFDAVASWLVRCLKKHKKFCINSDHQLPTRVLRVGSGLDDEDPHLVITKGEWGKWAALSHCWGPGPHFVTTTSNMKERQQRIPYANLPPTFRDAVNICRRLAIEYLWIDSLCIIQDSIEDWRAESRKMSQIYINALVTIIAEASASSSDGIFASANSNRPTSPMPLPCLDSKGNNLGTIYIRHGAISSTFLPAENSGDIHKFSPGPASERAWTFQEDILSSRTIRYAADNISWSCLSAFHGENDSRVNAGDAIYSPKNFRRKDMISGKGPHTRTTPQFWYTMVERYNQRSLTFDKDKLPAISGIAREVAAITKYTYKAGIWLEDAHTGLRWRSSGTGKRHASYTAPSWSWASLTHANYIFYNQFFASSEEIARIEEMNVTTVGADIYGQISSASLKISGPCHSVDAGFDQFPHVHNGNSGKTKGYGHNKTFFDWDVEKGKPGCGIICLQIAKILSGDEQKTPAKIDALLLQPIDQPETANMYQRVGLLHVAYKDQKWTKGWNWRTITII